MDMTLRDLFELGGWAMWPLLVFSIATLSLILERTLFLVIHRLNVVRLRTEVNDALATGGVAAAVGVCDAHGTRMLAVPVFRAALAASRFGERRIERAIETAAGERIHTIERGFDLLVALGSIAPITGFLGTVSGMIAAFNSIANAADINAQLVAGGIFEALITTAYGLAIAIVAITAYNLFAHFADRFAAELEEGGNELVTSLITGDAERSPA